MNRYELGRAGEQAACRFLEDAGYTVIARNLRVGHSEFDIICTDSKYIVFAEVKTRNESPDSPDRYGRPSRAMTQKKCDALIRGALTYIKVGGGSVGELKIHVDVVVTYDFQQLRPGIHTAAVLDIDFADSAAHICRGILGFHSLMIIVLRLRVAVLCLGLTGGYIGRIQRIKELSLLHDVALLKGIAEDLGGDHRFHRIGIGRFQGAAAAESICNGTHLYALCRITGLYRLGAVFGSKDLHRGSASKDDDQQQRQPPFGMPGLLQSLPFFCGMFRAAGLFFFYQVSYRHECVSFRQWAVI